MQWLPHFFRLFIAILFAINIPLHAQEQDFQIEYHALKGDLLSNVKKYTWKQNCPVKIADLIHLKVSYWGFDDMPHIGDMIVHRQASPEILLIFKELFENHFPIAKMDLMYEFRGDDNQSMKANNTVAFNCRLSTGSQTKYSLHSYGIAIDINPLINPYIKNGKVLPEEGAKYQKREKQIKGLIAKGSSCLKIFKAHGWSWGGDWHSLKDYQHFQKRLKKYKKEPRFSLKFKNLPMGAKVKIMNIIKPYRPEKFLYTGLYDVKIISENEAKRLWLTVDSDLLLDYKELNSLLAH